MFVSGDGKFTEKNTLRSLMYALGTQKCRDLCVYTFLRTEGFVVGSSWGGGICGTQKFYLA